MLPLIRPWYESWPPSVPCAFTTKRAEDNAAYLRHCLGDQWISKGADRGGPHLILVDWRNGGMDAFLRLNTLAEDLRTLEGVAGLAGVVAELKVSKKSEPTRHTLHTAALFKRGGQTLTRFYNPKNESLPDFELQMTGGRTPVEAKQLSQSEPERTFSAAAVLLQTALVKAVMIPGYNHPELHVVIKNIRNFPAAADVIMAVRTGLEAHREGGEPGEKREFRSPLFNIFMLPAPSFGDVTDAVSVQIVGPRDATEDARVERLLNKANKQLKKNTSGSEAAIMCLAFGRHQDPHAVAELISRKFGAGDFRSTSGVILHSFANQEGPYPRSVVDLVSYVANPNAHRPLGAFTLRGVGITASLLDNAQIDGTVSCYGVGLARGRVSGSNVMIGLSPMTRLPSYMIA